MTATLFSSQIGLGTTDPMQVVIVLVAGILLQVYGAKLLVSGGSGLARRAGVHPLVIGSTVVAFGASAPELFISLWAAGKGQGDLAVGNALGSVIANLGLVLGIAAVARPLRFRPQLFLADTPILVASAAMVAFLLRNSWIGRFEGTLLCACLLVYAVFLWFSAQVEADSTVIARIERDLPRPGPSRWVELAQLVGGMVLLVAGSRYLVKAAVSGAEMVGMTQAALALAAVPLLAATPELFVLISALVKKEKELAGGVVIGACIFNCLGVVGMAALLRPVLAPNLNQTDLGILLIATVAVLPLLHAKPKARQVIGVGLLVAYGMYLTQLLSRRIPEGL
ncbi:MAG: sodium:calcium antiporter [Verrucomicrobia bacterium]|nr:sodium:calcium antiporter [Verrucomicrobiota bacterium]